MLMFGLAQISHFGLISIPPESQLAFHIYYVKHENTLTCIRISWDSGGGGGGGGWGVVGGSIRPCYIQIHVLEGLRSSSIF